MKKIFKLESSEMPVQRHVDNVKSEVKKYLVRERKKKLPDGFDLWAFDCKFGDSEITSNSVFSNEIKGLIDKSISANKKSCYIEILSRPEKFKKKLK